MRFQQYLSRLEFGSILESERILHHQKLLHSVHTAKLTTLENSRSVSRSSRMLLALVVISNM